MENDYPSPYLPELPGLPELPVIVDARSNGLRLQGSSAKALPPMAQVGYSSNIRQMEAEQYANEIRAAFDISRQYDKRSQAIARAKNRQMERAAKQFGVR